MQPEVSKRALNPEFGVWQCCREGALESCIPHSSRYEEGFLIWSAGEGKATYIAFCVRLGGIQLRYIHKLTSFKKASLAAG